jgi:hypothetical protein
MSKRFHIVIAIPFLVFARELICVPLYPFALERAAKTAAK